MLSRKRQRDARHDARFSGRQLSLHPRCFNIRAVLRPIAGFEIERVRFDRLLRWLMDLRKPRIYPKRRRPLTSFCACELRSPAAFTEAGFWPSTALRQDAREWASRCASIGSAQNVCPEIDLRRASFYASLHAPEPKPCRFVIRRRRALRSELSERMCVTDLSPYGLKEKLDLPSAKWKAS